MMAGSYTGFSVGRGGGRVSGTSANIVRETQPYHACMLPCKNLMIAFFGKDLTHNMGSFLGKNFTRNIGAFFGKNLTQNMGAFLGSNLTLNMGGGSFYV